MNTEPSPDYALPIVMTDDEIHQLNHEVSLGLADTRYYFLNNFFLNLPAEDGYRPRIEQFGWDDRIVDQSPSDSAMPARERMVTWQQFFQDIDWAFEETGLDLDRVAAVRAAMHPAFDPNDTIEASQAKTEAARRALDEYILPAYLRLRIAGYSHAALMG